MRLMFVLGENESFNSPQALFPAVGFIRLDSWMFITQLGIHMDVWCMRTYMKHQIFANYRAMPTFGSCDEHLFDMRDCVQL